MVESGRTSDRYREVRGFRLGTQLRQKAAAGDPNAKDAVDLWDRAREIQRIRRYRRQLRARMIREYRALRAHPTAT